MTRRPGDPANGVEPGTSFEELPPDWVCPECGAPKDQFEKIDRIGGNMPAKEEACARKQRNGRGSQESPGVLLRDCGLEVAVVQGRVAANRVDLLHRNR